MNEPGAVIVLPKPDKRYKPGKIVKDKSGKWRGHPSTVELRPHPQDNSLNPPLLADYALVQWLEHKGVFA